MGIVHLPNGQTLTVSPSFGGLFFRSNDLANHHNVFPPGWTIILNSEDSDDQVPKYAEGALSDSDAATATTGPKKHIHRFRKPSVRNDHLFISSISNPSSNEFRPASSPTRQIAMMLWATLWWYFHQPDPTAASEQDTANTGKPRLDWRININREGIFKGKHLLPKLERMGLIASEDSSVGLDPEDGVANVSEGWTKMFCSRRTFWQLDARIFLFTLTPLTSSSPFPVLSPAGSRPASPNRLGGHRADEGTATPTMLQAASQMSLSNRVGTPPNPFTSASHLPTFYPPPPPQYTITNSFRHPIRPKPPRQGEIIYTRYVPSLEQYISFRVASLSKLPVAHRAPTSQGPNDTGMLSAREILRVTGASKSDATVPPAAGRGADTPPDPPTTDTAHMTDVELLHKWMNDPRVAKGWGEQGPLSHQEAFLQRGLTSKHSFPVIGCFDGRPFGYFEIYWVKEDHLALHMGGTCGDWDRGLHVLVGEQEFRGPHRVSVWLSALLHYCWLADLRTQVVMMEPRVDNVKLRNYAEQVGFYKQGEVSFPHKQSNLLKIWREAWEAPAL